jgi:hypothetical protein
MNEQAQAADVIRNGDCTPNSLAVLQKAAIQTGSALELVKDLISGETATCENEVDSVSQAMLLIEALGKTDPVTACILMAHLWPIAGRLYMHDVCDAIDLWIWKYNSPELASHLRLIASLEKDQFIQQHFQSWINPEK